MSHVTRLNRAMPSASMLLAILALLFAASTAGYAAGKIGTNDIKNNAVTSKKVKNGALKDADMVKEKKYKYVGRAGAPDYTSGGQGDCVWQSADTIIPGISGPGFRKDRFGRVHLAGVALAGNGLGGDGTCSTSETEDGIMFILPAAFRPAKTQIRLSGTSGVIVVGAGGLSVPGTSLPAGAVYSGDPTSGTVLDGISYEAAGSKLVSGRSTHRPGPGEMKLLKPLGIG